ncbi:MAG: acetyltransferase [Aureliella sp.]
MVKPIAIIGFGGHAHVVRSALLASGRDVLAATCLDPAGCGEPPVAGLTLHTDESLVRAHSANEIDLCLGLGTVNADSEMGHRQEVVKYFTRLGYKFVGVRHPTAWICSTADVAVTAQVHAGVVIQPGAVVQDFAIVNTKASVDHDCRVGKYCHIAPGATLSGNVELSDYAHVGTGASIIQGVAVGVGAMVGAGATVVRSVADGVCVVGTPARELQ